mmetsp:Transcript_22272/g.66916  ORF Transcript_22272/g.66916 Transcript_22272/m.66916 type:complete len:296 (-) Transcript_22272:209-1096(-)
MRDHRDVCRWVVVDCSVVSTPDEPVIRQVACKGVRPSLWCCRLPVDTGTLPKVVPLSRDRVPEPHIAGRCVGRKGVRLQKCHANVNGARYEVWGAVGTEKKRPNRGRLAGFRVVYEIWSVQIELVLKVASNADPRFPSTVPLPIEDGSGGGGRASSRPVLGMFFLNRIQGSQGEVSYFLFKGVNCGFPVTRVERAPPGHVDLGCGHQVYSGELITGNIGVQFFRCRANCRVVTACCHAPDEIVVLHARAPFHAVVRRRSSCAGRGNAPDGCHLGNEPGQRGDRANIYVDIVRNPW